MERVSEMKYYVIDTSVAVKWFSEDEDDAENAFRLRQMLLDGLCSITIPDLLIYELANALKHNPNFTSKDVKAACVNSFDELWGKLEAGEITESECLDDLSRPEYLELEKEKVIKLL